MPRRKCTYPCFLPACYREKLRQYQAELEQDGEGGRREVDSGEACDSVEEEVRHNDDLHDRLHQEIGLRVLRDTPAR